MVRTPRTRELVRELINEFNSSDRCIRVFLSIYSSCTRSRSCRCNLKRGQRSGARVTRGRQALKKLKLQDQVEGVQGEVGVKASVRRVRTFRWRQIKTIDKSSNLDRVHLTGFKAMHLLELGGFKRIKVAAAASKSSPRFDIICLSRIPSASTRQRLLRLRRAAQQRHHTSALRTLRRHLGFLGPRNHSASLGLALGFKGWRKDKADLRSSRNSGCLPQMHKSVCVCNRFLIDRDLCVAHVDSCVAWYSLDAVNQVKHWLNSWTPTPSAH